MPNPFHHVEELSTHVFVGAISTAALLVEKTVSLLILPALKHLFQYMVLYRYEGAKTNIPFAEAHADDGRLASCPIRRG